MVEFIQLDSIKTFEVAVQGQPLQIFAGVVKPARHNAWTAFSAIKGSIAAAQLQEQH